MCLYLRITRREGPEEHYYEVNGPEGIMLLGGKRVDIDIEGKKVRSGYMVHTYEFDQEGWVRPNPENQHVEIGFKIPIVNLTGHKRDQFLGRVISYNL